MQLSVERKPFLECLQLAALVADKATTMPVLNHVCLEADSQGLTVRATDSATYYSERTAAKTLETGGACVLAAKLCELISKLNVDEVKLELKEDQLAIKSGRGKYLLPILPLEDFPAAWALPEGEAASVSGEKLSDLLGRTIKACYTGTASRQSLECVLLEPKTGKLRAVATDGHRMHIAECECQNPEALKANYDLLLTAQAARALVRLAGKHQGIELSLDQGASKLFAEAGGAVSGFSLVAASYVQYEVVIPDKWFCSPVANRESLRAALDRVTTTAQKQKKDTAATPVRLAINSGELELKCQSPELGTSTEYIELDYEGPEKTCAYNPPYLDQALATMKSQDVSLRLNGDEVPIACLCGEGDPGCQYIIMGMRLSD